MVMASVKKISLSKSKNQEKMLKKENFYQMTLDSSNFYFKNI